MKQRENRQRIVPFLLVLITAIFLIFVILGYQWNNSDTLIFVPDIRHSLTDAKIYLKEKGNTCKLKERPSNVIYRGGNWQVASNGTCESVIYNAYYDNRTSVSDSALLRIFSVASHTHNADIYCQVWYSDFKEAVPLKAAVSAIGRGANVNGTEYMEYLYTCKLPTSLITPSEVSIAFESCGQATVLLPVVFANDTGVVHEFGVCVPVTYWHVSPFRIIEWMELNKLYGVTQVNIYNSSLFNPGLSVFLKYRDQGDLIMQQGPPPVDASGLWAIKLAVLAGLNDCMYRNMYQYRYLIAIDLDEVIIPRSAKNYTEMIAQIHRDTHAQGSWPAYMFHNAYFWTDFQPKRPKPHFSTILRYLTRTKVSPLNYAAKSIIDPRTCVVLTNHFCSQRVSTVGHYWTVGVNQSIATCQHYKKCHLGHSQCEKSMRTAILDESAETHRDALSDNMYQTLASMDIG